jgi:hypothetical protein
VVPAVVRQHLLEVYRHNQLQQQQLLLRLLLPCGLTMLKLLLWWCQLPCHQAHKHLYLLQLRLLLPRLNLRH